MNTLSNAEFNEQFRKRTFTFALRTLNFLEEQHGRIPRVIEYQLSKSATSVGANFRSFCRGRSSKERYAKICIVVEEADESIYWIQLIKQGEFDKSDVLEWLLSESEEILRVVVSIKKGFDRS